MKATIRVNRPIISSAPSNKFERAGGARISENGSTLANIGPAGNLEDLGDAVLKQQQTRDETEQAQAIRLKGRGQAIQICHRIPPPDRPCAEGLNNRGRNWFALTRRRAMIVHL